MDAVLVLDAPFIVGREEDVAEVGSFFTHDASGVPVLVTRDLGGRVHALKNMCMHRGTRLVLEERGTAEKFVCSLHAWTYDLCGRLGTLPISRCSGNDAERTHGALVPLPSEIRHGFVWVTASARVAIDVAAHLGAADGALAAMELERRVVYQRSASSRAADVGTAMKALADAAAARGARTVQVGPGSLVAAWDGGVSHVGLFPRGRELVEQEHLLLVGDRGAAGASALWDEAERAFA